MIPSKAPADSPAFRRPYESRRRREAAKRNPKSPVNKLLLRVLAVLVVLLLVTLGVVVYNLAQQPTLQDAVLTSE